MIVWPVPGSGDRARTRRILRLTIHFHFSCLPLLSSLSLLHLYTMIPTHDSHDESLPLLDTERQQASSRLPVRQLIALCTIRLADPIAFTQIFPYVNEMIQNLGIAKNTSQTGFYSGIVVCYFR